MKHIHLMRYHCLLDFKRQTQNKSHWLSSVDHWRRVAKFQCLFYTYQRYMVSSTYFSYRFKKFFKSYNVGNRFWLHWWVVQKHFRVGCLTRLFSSSKRLLLLWCGTGVCLYIYSTQFYNHPVDDKMPCWCYRSDMSHVY